ncbi:MAG: hypothetical protein RL213_1045 [Bacteroidota bacterium]|jgi:molybdopterin-guanine dinucleotide biosynthesis protein A
MDSLKNTPLFGLVLTGGESRRMGTDKALIDYHGLPQEERMRELLLKCCEQVFVVGKRPADLNQIHRLTDLPHLNGMGPAAGLLTAADRFPEVAWLVAGCDYPYLEARGLIQLVAHRSPEYDGVAFVNPDTQLPEPLVAIYEPSLVRQLPGRVKEGDSSLRRLLASARVRLIVPENRNWIMSVDTPEEEEQVRTTLRLRRTS